MAKPAADTTKTALVRIPASSPVDVVHVELDDVEHRIDRDHPAELPQSEAHRLAALSSHLEVA